MRTKILLASAAALVMGLASSNAQVYSANVVGYYNSTLAGAGGFTLIGNQLVNNTTNDVATLMASMPNKTFVQTWNGSSFDSTEKLGGVWTPTDPAIAVGQGFFVQTPVASGPQTNTFVGAVGVNIGSSITNTYATGTFNLVCSPLPYSGTIADTSNINLGTLPNKTFIQVWNQGTSAFDSSEKLGGVWTPTVFNISVGQGFFIQAPTTGPATWTQSL